MSSAPTLAFGAVTKYLALEASGPITIALVAAGATSCSNPLVQGDVTLDPGKLSTVALFFATRRRRHLRSTSPASPTTARPSRDSARVRVIHAALGTSTIPAAGVLAVRANAAKTTVLADHVEPRKVAAASDSVNVDGLGYVTATPIPPPTTVAIGAGTDRRRRRRRLHAVAQPAARPRADRRFIAYCISRSSGVAANTFAVLMVHRPHDGRRPHDM